MKIINYYCLYISILGLSCFFGAKGMSLPPTNAFHRTSSFLEAYMRGTFTKKVDFPDNKIKFPNHEDPNIFYDLSLEEASNLLKESLQAKEVAQLIEPLNSNSFHNKIETMSSNTSLNAQEKTTQITNKFNTISTLEKFSIQYRRWWNFIEGTDLMSNEQSIKENRQALQQAFEEKNRKKIEESYRKNIKPILSFPEHIEKYRALCIEKVNPLSLKQLATIALLKKNNNDIASVNTTYSTISGNNNYFDIIDEFMQSIKEAENKEDHEQIICLLKYKQEYELEYLRKWLGTATTMKLFQEKKKIEGLRPAIWGDL